MGPGARGASEFLIGHFSATPATICLTFGFFDFKTCFPTGYMSQIPIQSFQDISFRVFARSFGEFNVSIRYILISRCIFSDGYDRKRPAKVLFKKKTMSCKVDFLF